MTTVAATFPALYSARQRLRDHAAQGLARLRAQEAIHSLFVVLLVSTCALAVLLMADKYFSLSKAGINVWIIWAGVTALGIPYVLWRVFTPRLHEGLAAVLADDRMALKARLSTALTLDLNDERSAEFNEAFFAEALGRLERIDVREAFPVHVPKAFVVLLFPIAACVAIQMFMPYQDKLGLVKAREEKRKAEAVRQKAAALLEGKLEDLKRKVEEAGDEKPGVFKVKQLIQQANDVAKELRDGKRNPEEAMIALGQIKREIQEEKEKMTQGKEFLDRLAQLNGKDLNLDESDLTKEVSQALKMGDAGLAARELRKLAQQVKRDILDDPGKSDAQKQQQLEQLKREVEKLAGALAEDEALREGLKELSEKAMSAAEFQALQQEIKKQMEKEGKGNKQKGNEIEQDMEKVAEELERLEEDNDADLNEDEEKEMENLDDVEKALDEGMEGLANPEAGNQGDKQGDQPGGKKPGGKQKSGQKGQKSGKKAGGKKGAMNRGKGQAGQEGGQEGKQGGGKGGNEGKGDNNGRPGDGLGDGKGMGLRPYHEIADPGFTAEKVKGNLQNGAITGLSHFRGQGAKGDAPKEFVQALTAAEQDAASSLELDRIPADARDTVRDYFLKVREGANMPTPQTPPASQTAPAEKKDAPATAPAPKAPPKETLKE